MAKNEKNAAKPAAKATEVTVENVEEQIHSDNKMEDSIVAQAEADLQKEKDDKKKAEMKEALVMAEFINKREVLQLKKPRDYEKIIKETLNASKENLDKLKSGEITPRQYDAAMLEVSKKRRDEFNKIDEKYRNLLIELKNNFPSYYSVDWEYERWCDGSRRRSWSF